MDKQPSLPWYGHYPKICKPTYTHVSHTQSSELRYTANTQLEHLHARYTGTGHADLTKYEWLTHQHRDTLSSIVGHPTLLSYLSIADGEATGRVKFEMVERMLQPCGPPPAKDD
ncbi:splicing factor 3B subunit 10-domain-containing protein [Irpex rosettiformis]|uniref:Splicing factor 3B subunit 10-domain-containing protein n=1 Tax=Irpex rosettiformis TaxID=378272 RepID=A0ACB8ULS6_9APHY|nr:splicing factor 3B subunit 10-domain-containing protein [Irpex rosettiformis]